MKQGEVVFTGKSSKGKEFLIRYLNKDDLEALLNYINELSQEQTFILYQGEKVTLEEETKYLQGQLEKMEKNECVQLLVFSDNKLIGLSSIDMRKRAEKHLGDFGISLHKDYRGEGIGSKLMELVLTEAKNNLPELKIVLLGAFGNNAQAIAMYKKFGFVQYSLLPKGIFYKGNYIDGIDMYKVIRDF